MDTPSEKENLKSSVSNEKEDKSENDLLASNEGHKLSNSKHSSDSEYESAEEDQSIVDDEGEEIEEILTEEVKKERRSEAQVQKEEGNDFFKKQEYELAIKSYSRALKLCPKDFVKDRAILFSNRAACRMKKSENEEAILDSNKALELYPQYLKALLRRAELYEKVDKLEEALADYQKVVEMDPSQHSARAACLRLPEQIKEKNEKMKEEMIGKLKELGNMVLKPFGLSTENFQLNQDPNSGGYNINFKQGPSSSWWLDRMIFVLLNRNPSAPILIGINFMIMIICEEFLTFTELTLIVFSFDFKVCLFYTWLLISKRIWETCCYYVHVCVFGDWVTAEN